MPLSLLMSILSTQRATVQPPLCGASVQGRVEHTLTHLHLAHDGMVTLAPLPNSCVRSPVPTVAIIRNKNISATGFAP